jgi:hypothetical protein
VLLMNAQEDFHLEQDAEELQRAIMAGRQERRALAAAGAAAQPDGAGALHVHKVAGQRPQPQEDVGRRRPAAQAFSDPGSVAAADSSRSAPLRPDPAANHSTFMVPPANTPAVTWLTGGVPPSVTNKAGQRHLPPTSSLDRCVIGGTNHITLIGGVGQKGDVTTDVIMRWVHLQYAARVQRRAAR